MTLNQKKNRFRPITLVLVICENWLLYVIFVFIHFKERCVFELSSCEKYIFVQNEKTY